MRIIMSGGGTAGHINPAIAVADALRRLGAERGETVDILFVGTPRGMENTLVSEAGYPIRHIDVRGLERRLTLRNLGAVASALKAFRAADELLDLYRPDAVFGTGGYVCYPIVNRAARRGIFTALHESNASAGLTVKMLSDKVSRVYLNFETTKNQLRVPELSLTVGNPVRGEILRLDRAEARRQLGISSAGSAGRTYADGKPIGSYRHVILSFGGSLGAATLNREMLRLMDGFVRARPDVLHVHACGRSGYAEFRREADAIGVSRLKNVIISEFIYDMPLWLAAADLVVCRAGATTVSELAAVGRASILIPSPNVAGDHQTGNARVLGDSGAAFVVRETDEDLSRLSSLVSAIIEDRRLRERMEENARLLAPRRDAAEVIAEELLDKTSSK